MCDQDHFDHDEEEYEKRGLVTRRQFGVLLGAGVSMMLPAVANAVAVTESDVTITTPDGTADAYFVHPATGTAPGILVWPDIFGLRPAFRQMGKRLAESGYSVLVVNQFYRVKKPPIGEQGSQTPIPTLLPLAQALNETTHTTDAKAFIAWLDGQPSVAKNRRSGRRATAWAARWRSARRSGRIASARSPRSMAAALLPAAEQPAPAGVEDQGAVPDRDRVNDDSDRENVLKDIRTSAEIEVYGGDVCPRTRVYNGPDAEKAWTFAVQQGARLSRITRGDVSSP